MNKIFKVVWSKVKHCYVVVSEIAKNTTSGGARRCRMGKVSLAAAMAAAVLTGSFAMPNSAWADAIALADRFSYIAIAVSKDDETSYKDYEDHGYIFTKVKVMDEDGLDTGNTVNYWVQDGYVVYAKQQNAVVGDGSKYVVYKVIGAPKSETFNPVASIQVHEEQTSSTTVINSALEKVTLNPFGGVTNAGGVTAPPTDHYVLNRNTRDQIVLLGEGTTEGTSRFYDYFKREADGLEYIEATQSYVYNNQTVNRNSVYFIGKEAGVFVIDGKVYDGVVYGNNGETLLTGQQSSTDGETTLITYWGAEIEDYNLTVAESGLTVGNLKEAFDILKGNDDELSASDVKEIKITPNDDKNGGNVDLLYNDAHFNGGVPSNVSGTLSFAAGGGTSETGDTYIRVSQGNTYFDLQTGSRVVANGGEPYDSTNNTLETISINGNDYRIAAAGGTGTMSSWTVGVWGKDNKETTAVIPNEGKLAFKGEGAVEVSLDDDTITISATDTNRYTTGVTAVKSGKTITTSYSQEGNNATKFDGINFKEGSNVTLGLEDKTITINATDYHLVGATEKNEDGKYTYSGEYSVGTDGKLVLNVQNGTDPVAEKDKITITGLVTKSALEQVQQTANAGWKLAVNDDIDSYNVKPEGGNDSIRLKATNGNDSTSNNLTISRDGEIVTFNFSDTPSFTSVTIENDDNDIVFSKKNISVGSNQIHNVATGTADNDAVNFGQLKSYVAANDKDTITELNVGKNGSVTVTKDVSGKYTVSGVDTKYKVDKGEVTADSNQVAKWIIKEEGENGQSVGEIVDTDTKILSGKVGVDEKGKYSIQLQTNEPNGNGGSGNKTIDIVNLHDYYTSGVSVNGSNNDANVQFNRNDGSSYNVNFTAGGGTYNDETGKYEDRYVKISADGSNEVITLSTGSVVRANSEATGNNKGALYQLAINGEVYTVATSDSVDSAMATAKTEVVAGNNVKVVETSKNGEGEDGHTVYTVHAAETIIASDDKSFVIENPIRDTEKNTITYNIKLADTVTIGSSNKMVVINGENFGIDMSGQKITGLADGAIESGSKDAINGGQLNAVKTELTNNDKYLVTNPDPDAEDGEYTVVENKVTLKVKNGEDVVINGIASKTELVKLAETVNNVAGEASKKTTVSTPENGNLKVTSTNNGFGGTDYEVDLNNDITLTTKDANDKVTGQVEIKSSDSTVTVGTNDAKKVSIDGDKGTVEVGENVSINGVGSITVGTDNTKKVSIDGAKGTVAVGDKVSISANGNASFDKVSINGANGSINAGNVTVNTDNKGTINGLTNTTWSGTTNDASRAATEGQLQKLQETINDFNTNVTQQIDGVVKYDRNQDGTVDKTRVTLEGGTEGTTITNVKAGEISTTSTDAINGSQLHNVMQDVEANATQISTNKTNIETNATNITNLTNKVNQGWNAQIGGKTIKKVQMGGALNFVAGNDNIVLDGTDGNIKVSTADEVSFTKVTVGDVVVDSNGIDAGLKKITNVKDGDVNKDSKDAVNGSQLFATNQFVVNNYENIQNLSAQNQQLYSRINQLGSKVNKVGAGAAALAALHPMDFDPDDKLSFSAGVGNYAGQTATALGAFYRPNEKVMMSIGGTYGNNENMVNMGVSFALDRTNNISNSRTAMAREIVDLREQVATQGQQIAQLVALVNQLTGVKEPVAPTVQPFPDVPANHWAYEYLNNLVAMGVIEGYPDGTFGGDRTMTRYEFATMLFKAMQNGAVLSEQIRQEFNAELGRIRVDRIKGADDDANKIERVRVNNYEDRDDYGSKIVMVSAGK